MDAQRARLFKKVRQGKAVLFMGAGASKIAGAPLGGELAALIQKEFIGAATTSPDFIEVCTQVLDTPGVDRAAVEHFIRSTLDLQPSTAHKALCLNRWQAIFTTNFDDLIETAYRTSPNRLQRCDSCFGREFARTQNDYIEVVRLFKLMGCVTGRDTQSQMALSRSDYNRKLRQRGPLLKLLFDFVKDGTLIYTGYSFRDGLARDIIDEVAEEVGIERLPWSWALLPEWDDSVEALLRQRKILPLKMSFEDFLAELNSMPSDDGEAHQSTVTLTIRGMPIELPQHDVTMYSREFYFLNDHTGVQLGVVDNDVSAKNRFLEGGAEPWLGIRRGWAFTRDLQPELQSRLVELLKTARDKEAPVVLLSGPAGSGKTTLSRVVAYEIYRSVGVPCLFLHANKTQPDYLVIDSFARQIQRATTSAATSPKLVPLLIVVDEAAERIQDIRRLTHYLISRGVPSVILAVTRENEWSIAQKDRQFKVPYSKYLKDSFSTASDEKERLVHHLRSINVLVSAEEDLTWVQRIGTDYDDSFQTALYYLAEPTRPPLAKAIRSEYDRLLPVAKRAYRYVSIFYQFGIPLDLELLARALDISYDAFIDSVYDPASLGVIVEDPQQPPDVIRFKGRSRMVCNRILEHCYQGASEWIDELQTIVSALLPQNVNEIETVRRLLISKMGPKGAQPFGNIEQLKELFRQAFDAGMRDSATLHHFALLLLDADDFAEAEHYIAESLAVLNDDKELGHFKTESRQNLLNSMGMVFGRRGLNLQLSGDETNANGQFDRAAQLFRSARSGTSPSAYPYYCESFINYSRARNSSKAASKLKLLAAALKNLDESNGNAPDEERSSIQELEAKILTYVATHLPNIENLINSHAALGDPDADYLRVRLSLRDDASQSQLFAAYDTLTFALARTPTHVGCLRLAARLHLRIYHDDWEGWSKLLYRWYRADDQPEQCGLLFDLGYSYCQLGQYVEATRYFEKLDALSAGHPRRSGVVKTIQDGQVERRLSGVATNIVSAVEGYVRCDAIGRELKFIPLKQRFTVAREQRVTFSIGLNYRGMLAIELRPA